MRTYRWFVYDCDRSCRGIPRDGWARDGRKMLQDAGKELLRCARGELEGMCMCAVGMCYVYLRRIYSGLQMDCPFFVLVHLSIVKNLLTMQCLWSKKNKNFQWTKTSKSNDCHWLTVTFLRFDPKSVLTVDNLVDPIFFQGHRDKGQSVCKPLYMMVAKRLCMQYAKWVNNNFLEALNALMNVFPSFVATGLHLPPRNFTKNSLILVGFQQYLFYFFIFLLGLKRR